MKPAAVSHVLMKMEHRFTSLMELLGERRRGDINLSKTQTAKKPPTTGEPMKLKAASCEAKTPFTALKLYSIYCGLIEEQKRVKCSKFRPNITVTTY